ncbi:MAG: rhomboid family intramembrane serine protease [Bacteroidetes bacterium]|nr:rhomboid family intramembrane serine protease [Bacteroidota bacterium]
MNPSPLDQFKYFFRQKTTLVQLIKINIYVWLAVTLISLFSFLFQTPITNKVLAWLELPANTTVLLQRPWTVFTYMFLQQDFFHILFNMIMLFFGGILFTQYLGDKKLLQTYIWGGISGGLFFILAYNVFPVFAPVLPYAAALGASASVIAILVAIAVVKPDMQVQLILLGNVKLKYIAIGLVAIDLMSIDKSNPGGHIAHIGGAAYGALMALNLKYNVLKLPDFKLNNIFSPKPKMKYSRNENQGRPLSDDEFNRQKAEKQKRIDEILDKISKTGYDKLTKEEKEFLFKSSNK